MLSILSYNEHLVLFCGAWPESANPDKMLQNRMSDGGIQYLPTECSIKIKIKMKRPPNNPFNRNGLAQLITVIQSI